jgi:predicted nucleic acid-binding protein
VIVVDTSGIISALFPDQRHHEACAKVIREAKEPLIMSPFVLAEVDYLISKHGDVETELLFLEEIERRAYQLASFDADDVMDARAIIARYRALDVGLADASTVVVAARYMLRDILTLDERHFRMMRPLNRKTFRILPADL